MGDCTKIIAVDFDGCLVEDKYPEIGDPILSAVCALMDEQEKGARVILWTCRRGDKARAAADWCAMQGIRVDAVNENLPEMTGIFGGDTRKIFADEYWDDRAVRVPPDWGRERLLRRAIRTYGVDAQLDMVIEEMSELTKALVKLRRATSVDGIAQAAANVAEEIADVQIMLDQMKLIFGGVAGIEAEKLERLAGRLNLQEEEAQCQG